MRSFRPITAVSEPQTDSESEFVFAVTGDGRPTLPGMGFPLVTRRIMQEVALIRPAFLVYTGDAVWGYNDTPDEFSAELDAFRALADTTGVPVYNVPGNHEMQTDLEAIAALQKWGQDLYGSFDVGPYHFVALNTDEYWKEGRVCDEQLEWLEADLAESRDADAVFVFMHRPLYSHFQGDFNPDDAVVLHELFRTHPVRAVFASHDHFFAEETRDGIRYVTAGGAGSPLYAQPSSGGFPHYVLVMVRPESVEYNVVTPFNLEVEYLAGNDGRALVSRARIANTTDRDLLVRNLEFHAPRAEEYAVSVDFVDWERKRVQHAARVARAVYDGRGSAAVGVEVEVPTGTAFYVTLEASSDATSVSGPTVTRGSA